MKTIKATTFIRKAINNTLDKHGVSSGIFTNLYDTCRTVKVYGTHNDKANADIVHNMELLAQIIPGLTVKVRSQAGYRGVTYSIIVRIPRDAADIVIK